MATHNELGKTGERLAVKFLTEAGYKILETNWRSGKAEIDIIAVNQRFMCVIEVKTRSSLAFGSPQDFVNPKKIKLLLSAVNSYVNQKNLDVEIRFDIIAIHKNKDIFEVEHIVDAFYHF